MNKLKVFFTEKLPSAVKTFFTEHIGYKLLALCLGIVLWGLLSNIQDPLGTQVLNIPIAYQNEELLKEKEQLLVLEKPETVQIIVERKQSQARQIKADMFSCTADLTVHNGGDLSAQLVHVTVTQNDRTGSIISWSYQKNDPSVLVSMDRYIGKTFPVTYRLQDELAEGLILNEPEISPAEVKIYGAESWFAKLDCVSVFLNQDELTKKGGNFNEEKELFLLDGNGNIIGETSGFSYERTTVMVRATVSNTQSVKVLVGGTTGAPLPGFRYVTSTVIPETISVQGLKSAVADFTELTIPANYIDISGASESAEYEIDLTDLLPKNVTVIGTAVVKVKVEIEAEQTETFRLLSSDLILLNGNENYEYVPDEIDYEITVTGLKEDLEKFNVSVLRPTVDLSSCVIGKNICKIRCENVSGYTKIAGAEGLSVNITVREKESENKETEETKNSETENH